MNRPPPSFLHVVLAPWRWMFSPRRAGAALAGGSPPAVAASFLTSAILCAAVIFAIILATLMLRERMVVDNTVRPGVHYELETRSAADLLDEWRGRGLLGEFSLLTLVGVFVLSGMVGAMAVVQWPIVHAGGARARSLGRTYAAVVSVGGLVVVLLAVWGFVLVQLENAETRMFVRGATPYFLLWFQLPKVILGSAALALLTWWIGRACMGSRRDEPECDAPPVCEGCGYNLTHLPESGRCTECGLEVARSLTPGDPRCGPAWEARPTARTFLRTVRSIIFEPSRFYGALRLRSPEAPARRFAVLQYLLIGLGAGLWLATAATLKGWYARDLVALIMLPMVMSLAAPLLGWLTHRGVAALTMGYCFVGSELPHPSYARKIVAWESAFLWTFCAYDGCLVSTLIMFNGNLGPVLSGVTILGVPLDALLIAGGNGALVLLWLHRYRTIVRRVRWANY